MKALSNWIMKYNRLSLKQKFLFAILITVLIPMIAATGVMSVNIKRMMLNQALSSVESTVTQVSESLDEMIKGQTYNISNIVANDEKIYECLTSDYQPPKIQKYVDTIALKEKISSGYARPYQSIAVVGIMGANGVLFNMELPSYESEEVYQRVKAMQDEMRPNGTYIKWYGLTDNFFTRHVSADERENKVVYFVMNIYLPKTGEYAGIQIYAIQESLINEKYNSSDIAKKGNIFILNDQGELISSSREEYVTGDAVLNDDYVALVHENQGKTVFDKDKKFVAVRESSLNEWRTVGEIPIDTIYGKVNVAFNIFFLVILVCGAFCFGLFAVMSGRIISPIKNIIHSMENFSKGQMKPYVQADSKSELSLLEDYYNRMIDRINYHIIHEYEMDKQKKQLELDILMSQINSHFLSNTLESIVWKARSAKAYDVAKMASSLGRFFKLSSSKGNMFVTVEDEIEHIKAYVNIQKIRYGDKFDFTLYVDTANTPEIQSYKTLKILLQPLVENAIMHGLDGLNRTVNISVRIYVHENRLMFEVADDGKGMDEAVRLAIFEASKTEGNRNKHIGLKNIRERIRLYFMDIAEDADLTIQSEPGQGTKVTLTLPVI